MPEPTRGNFPSRIDTRRPGWRLSSDGLFLHPASELLTGLEVLLEIVGTVPLAFAPGVLAAHLRPSVVGRAMIGLGVEKATLRVYHQVQLFFLDVDGYVSVSQHPQQVVVVSAGVGPVDLQ
jgi:hypothetical protein